MDREQLLAPKLWEAASASSNLVTEPIYNRPSPNDRSALRSRVVSRTETQRFSKPDWTVLDR